MATQSFIDEKLGEVVVHRNARSRGIRIKPSLTGQLVAIAPPLIPLSLIKLTVKKSRKDLEKIRINNQLPLYAHGQAIGKSHSLHVVSDDTVEEIAIVTRDRTIICRIPPDLEPSSPKVQQAIREYIVKILRKEAKTYLTRRLAVLAGRHGYSYAKVRFPHAASRWGSCSSNGTISLNIALMKLSLEEIDYVLIHELCHTIEMNHSSRFWQLVEAADPHYRLHRKTIKNQTPAL
ncbi:MAG TPA: SprT family zinc-dependent metalloprotease [Candidatus Saccharibacteria bacterium]|nr:SprT family zinc-dependent metalloprotease [Candidatus Saccharibacteria bacterium]HMR38544.1 SprT family zinc-dependent metalloprotease [Candidatus Saccharibacteria bacterium]